MRRRHAPTSSEPAGTNVRWVIGNIVKTEMNGIDLVRVIRDKLSLVKLSELIVLNTHKHLPHLLLSSSYEYHLSSIFEAMCAQYLLKAGNLSPGVPSNPSGRNHLEKVVIKAILRSAIAK